MWLVFGCKLASELSKFLNQQGVFICLVYWLLLTGKAVQNGLSQEECLLNVTSSAEVVWVQELRDASRAHGVELSL